MLAFTIKTSGLITIAVDKKIKSAIIKTNTFFFIFFSSLQAKPLDGNIRI